MPRPEKSIYSYLGVISTFIRVVYLDYEAGLEATYIFKFENDKYRAISYIVGELK